MPPKHLFHPTTASRKILPYTKDSFKSKKKLLVTMI